MPGQLGRLLCCYNEKFSHTGKSLKIALWAWAIRKQNKAGRNGAYHERLYKAATSHNRDNPFMLRTLRWAKAARQAFSTKNALPQEDSMFRQQEPPLPLGQPWRRTKRVKQCDSMKQA